MLDAKDVAGLRFVTAGTFASTGAQSFGTNASVTVGRVPTGTAVFMPVLQLPSGSDVDTSSGSEQFTPKGLVAVENGASYQTLLASSPAVNIASLLGSGVAISGASPLNALGETLNATTLSITANGAAGLGGTLVVPSLGNATVRLSGGGIAQLSATGSTIGDASVDLLTGSFNVGNLTFAGADLGFQYDTTSQKFSFYGNRSFDFKGNQVSVALGDSTTPGVVVTNGQLNSLNFGVTGNIAIGGLTFTPSKLGGSYAAATSTYTVSGGASFGFKGSAVNVGLGSSSTPGLVITNGTLSQLGFTVDSGLQIGGVQFTTKSLKASYTDSNSTLLVSGSASFALNGDVLGVTLSPLTIVNGSFQSVTLGLASDFSVGGVKFQTTGKDSAGNSVGLGIVYDDPTSTFTVAGSTQLSYQTNTILATLGSPAQGNVAATKGLVIINGQLRSLDAAITGTFVVAGTTIMANGLRLTYDSPNLTYTVTGTASFTTTQGTSFSLKLGGTPSGDTTTKGLVITNGKLTSLDAALTGSLTIASVAFATDSLRLSYDAADSRYAISGKAALTFGASSGISAASLTADLGSSSSPGLVVQNGSIQKLDVTTNGSVTISGVVLTIKNVRLTYDGASTYTATGTASFTTSEGNPFTIQLGGTPTGDTTTRGLVLVNGKLTSLDAALTGSLTISGVTFKTDGLRLAYMASGPEYDISGKSSLSYKSSSDGPTATVNVDFGPATKPGLVIKNDSLQSLAVIGNGSVTISGSVVNLTGVAIAYDKAAGTFTAKGTASLTTTGGTTLTVALGDASTSGLVIQNGSLVSINAAITGTFVVAGTTIMANGLRLTYDSPTSTYTVTGAASFTTSQANLFKLQLGGTPVGDTTTKGLVITNGSLTSLDAALTGSLTIASVTFATDSLRLSYDAADSRYAISGKAALTFVASSGISAASLTADLGSSSSPGLVVQNGSIQKLDVTTNGSVTISGVVLTIKNVRLTYDGASTYTATGTASFTTSEGNPFTIQLGGTPTGDTTTRGLVLVNGKLTSLDAALTGSLTISGVTFKTDGLRLAYMASGPEYDISGKSSLSYKSSSSDGLSATVNVDFGPATKPGLVIKNDSLQSLAVTGNGSVTISGSVVNLTGVSITYDKAAGTFTAKGTASLTTQAGTTLTVALGDASTSGLVIQNGSLVSINAAITGSFSVSGVTFAAKNLRVAYNALDSSFALSGLATLSFKSSSSTDAVMASLSADFGPANMPGLLIKNGSIQNLSVIGSGSVTIGGLTIQANNIQISYSANGDFSASGSIGFKSDSTNFQATIPAGGLVIQGGTLTNLNATINGGFSISDVTFAAQNLNFQYQNANGVVQYAITGSAMATFKVGQKTSRIGLGFGSADSPGLVIRNGTFQSLALQITGDLNLGGVTISPRNLSFFYRADLSEFIAFGGLTISTGESTEKTLNSVTATLGQSFEAPGIAIKDGSLQRLDIKVDGNIDLGGLNFQPTDLRVIYNQASSSLAISGQLGLKIGKGSVNVKLPGNGLQINTDTGAVSLSGIKFQAGGFSFGSVGIKDLQFEYTSDGQGNIAIGGGLILDLRGNDAGAVFRATLVNHQFASIAVTVSAPIPIGSLTLTSISGSLSGINDGNYNFNASVSAFVGFGSLKAITLQGNLIINSNIFQLNGNAVLFDPKLGSGQATLLIDFNKAELNFNSNFAGLNQAIRGDLRLNLELKTGNFDAGVNLTAYVPQGAPVFVGKQIGEISVGASLGPRAVTVSMATLPAAIAAIGASIHPGTLLADRPLLRGKDFLSPDGTYKLELQHDGNVVEQDILTHRVVFATGKFGDRLLMQDDGNLVEYEGKRAIWSTNTQGNPGAFLSVQNDGNLVVNSADRSRALWSSNSSSDENQKLQLLIVDIAGATEGDHRRLIADAVNSRQYGQISDRELAAYVAHTRIRRNTTVDQRFLTFRGSIGVAGSSISGLYYANLSSNTYRGTIDYVLNYFFGKKRGDFVVSQNGDPNSLPGYVVENKPGISGGVNAASLKVSASAVHFAASSQSQAKGHHHSKGNGQIHSAVVKRPSISVHAAASEKVIKDTGKAETSSLQLASEFTKQRGEIDSVVFNKQKNVATVNYTAQSELPASVSIFVDSSDQGYNGKEIDPGLTTLSHDRKFEWTDVADSLPPNYQPGQKLYFYASIDDGVHTPYFTKYSKGYTAPSRDLTISAPTSTQYEYAGTPLIFSKANGNAITLTDPVEAIEPTDLYGNNSDKILVILQANNGEINVSSLPSGVTLSNNGTEEVELSGRADLVDAALEGMAYTPSTGTLTDTLTIQTNRLNDAYVGTYVTSTVPIQASPLVVTDVAPLGATPVGTPVLAMPYATVTNVNSDVLNAVVVAIKDFNPATESLGLNSAGISDILDRGITPSYDPSHGVLTFNGGAITIDDAQRLLRNIQYTSEVPTASKFFTIALADDAGDIEVAVNA